MIIPRSGYHSLRSFDQTFHLEKRWKLVREMGSGAYGVVMSVRIPSHPIPSHPHIPLSLSLFSPLFYINRHPIIVSSAADEISGETVAIKMVTRVFAKATLAKRALRELALLRHFNNHENITGLIDVDGIAETFNEM
jgi:serine/threonine protein kinase